MAFKALVFSDIHGDSKTLSALLSRDADYYFSAGDLTNFDQESDELGAILATRAQQVYVIPGNHESAESTAKFCAKFGLHDFHGQSFQAGEYTFAGLGYSNITPFHTPGEYTETELAEKLEPFEKIRKLVMVCHCPPKDTVLDRSGPGLHFGSPAVRGFIEKAQPEYFFCGHIHEAGAKSCEIGRTRAFNVGKRGYLLEL